MTGNNGNRDVELEYNRLRDKSLILNFDNPLWAGHHGQPWVLDRTVQGIKALLKEYSEPDNYGRPGLLESARNNLREAKRAWEYFNNAQMLPARLPQGRDAEKINLAAANLRLVEDEVARLRELLKDAEAREKKRESETIAARPKKVQGLLTCCPMTLCEKCGKTHLKEVDTRPVNCAGEFTDMDSDLSWLPLPEEIRKIRNVRAYFEAVKPLRRQASTREKQKRKEAVRKFANAH